MITTIVLTAAALLVQFLAVYAFLVITRQDQDAGDVVAPAVQRGRQVYYNAFSEQPTKVAPSQQLAA